MKGALAVSVCRIALVLALGFGLEIETRGQTFKTLYTFGPGDYDSAGSYTNMDGASPVGGLATSGSVLFGTSTYGGSAGNGTVFRINIDGTGFTNLHIFEATSGASSTNTEGAAPRADLIWSGDTLYGTANQGGAYGKGTVFRLNADGSSFAVLHQFDGSGGEGPRSRLLLFNGRLYGMTDAGGDFNQGTIFALNPDGTGFTNLHSFAVGGYDQSFTFTNYDGSRPESSLTVSGNTLFGAAIVGGVLGGGTIFKINADGTQFTKIYDFAGISVAGASNSGGAGPNGGLVLVGASLYGTAGSGGMWGEGTLFTLATNGTDFKVLREFGGSGDGGRPNGLILNGNTVFGTTMIGGTAGDGTVFGVNLDGTGYATLHNLTDTEGAAPFTGVILSASTLYGTTYYAGQWDNGTVFSVTLPGPRLTIVPAGQNVVLMWPTNTTGFFLQSSTNLSNPIVWTLVSSNPMSVNGQYAVTNAISGGKTFFRLMQ